MIVGRIVDQTPDSVALATSAGRLMLARAAIAEIKAIPPADLHDGNYWPPDPHDTRLFFGPTGRTLARGTGYMSDQYVFLFAAAWGVTDRLTIGGGMSLFPSNDFFANNLYYLTPKLGLVRGETFNVSLGALIGFAGRSNGSAGVYYLAATSGRSDASLTYGVGYSYFNRDVSGNATLLLGGNIRVSRRLSLMSENYVFTGTGGGHWVPIYGLRVIGERMALDFGFVNYVGPGTEAIVPGLPWVGFAVKF